MPLFFMNRGMGENAVTGNGTLRNMRDKEHRELLGKRTRMTHTAESVIFRRDKQKGKFQVTFLISPLIIMGMQKTVMHGQTNR